MTITVTYQGLTTSMSWIYLRQTGKYEYHHVTCEQSFLLSN